MKFSFWTIFVIFMLSTLSAQPKNKQIDKWILLANHESAFRRKWAASQLAMFGEAAVKKIIQKLPSQNFLARRELVSALGKIGGSKAIEQLLLCLRDVDKGVRNRAALALVDMCHKKPSVSYRIKNLYTRDPIIQKEIKNLLRITLYCRVESTLRKLIPEDGGMGFYEGQFDPLIPLGKDAIEPLLRMFEQEKYSFFITKYGKDETTAYTMRLFAGEALISFKSYIKVDPRSSYKKRRFAFNVLYRLRRLRNSKNKNVQEIALYCLYELGTYRDRRYLDLRIQSLKRRVRDYELRILRYKRFRPELVVFIKGKMAENFHELGLTYLRIRRYKQSIETLKKAIQISPRYNLAFYNLACAYAMSRQIKKGIDALEKAVACGYDDARWIQQDGDLRNLRHLPRFKKLIKKMKK